MCMKDITNTSSTASVSCYLSVARVLWQKTLVLSSTGNSGRTEDDYAIILITPG